MILKRLIQVPQIPDMIIRRPRLLNKLITNNTKTLTLICATAGSGKTILLSEFSSLNENTHWIQGSQLIESPELFILYFIESTRTRYSSFGYKTELFLKNSDKNLSIDDVVLVFINEFIDNISDKITFVIDDFHLIKNDDNNWLNIFLNQLLSKSPENLKFIISTREYPEFETGRLKGKRNFGFLSNEDLSFTEHEVSELIHYAYPSKKNILSAQNLLNFTSGWITGLHLIMQTNQTPDDYLAAKYELDDLYVYFAEDIFINLQNDEKIFLIHTCFLNEFAITDCESLSTIKNPQHNLKQILKKNIFIESKNIENNTIYSYQKLFSKFLRQYVNKTLSKSALNRLFINTADIYLSSNNLYYAMKYYLLAQLKEKAINIIIEKFDAYFLKSDYLTLSKLFSLCQWEVIEENKTLLLYYLKFTLTISDYKNAARCIDKLESISNQLTPIEKSLFFLNKSKNLIYKNNIDEAIELIESISFDRIHFELNSERHYLLCKSYYRKGFEFYSRSLDIAYDIIENFADKINIVLLNETYHILGNIYSDTGDYTFACRCYEQTLINNDQFIGNLKSYANLTDYYSLVGDYEKAYTFLQKATNIYKTFPITNFEKYFYRSSLKFYSNISNYKEAIIMNKILINDRTILENKYEILAQNLTLSELLYKQSRSNEAIQILSSSMKSFKNADPYIKLIFDFYNFYYCCNNIKSIETENVLLEFLNYHISNNVLRSVPPIQFHLADHYIQAGNLSTAEDYLRKALSTISQKSYISFAEQQYILSRHVYDFAVSKNIEKKFIKEIHTRLIEKKELSFIDEDFREELLEQELNITDIRLEAFGTTDFYLRGSLTGDDKWIRKKSKILLAYLMSDPVKVHTKDKIMDMFFDELPAEKADVVYHSTLYNIRTALKIYNIKQDTPKRSKQKPDDYNPAYLLYEDKTLRLNPDFHYRSSNIEFEKLYSSSRLPGLQSDEKLSVCLKAAELYKGDFLPGYYDNWCEELRLKYRNMFIVLAEDLLSLLETAGRTEEAARYAELLLNTDKLNDKAHLSIINSFAKQHNTTAARNRCRLMVKIYNEELGEDPPVNVMDAIKPLLDN